MRAIGVDLGTRRVGVAVSSGTLATPYEVLERASTADGGRRADHVRLAELVAETGAELVVVGLPLSMDGTEGRAARKALIEVDQLAETLDVPVEVWDERLSTVTAHRVLAEGNLDERARRKVVDKVAAAVILQAWIDAHPQPVAATSRVDEERS